MSKAKNHIIRFPLTKVEDGEMFPPSQIPEDMELKDVCSFNISVDKRELGDAEILSYQVVYDGISAGSNHEGLSINEEEDSWEGYPAPIIRFTLSKPIESEKLIRAVEYSRMMMEVEDGLFYFQDNNGWVHKVPREDYELLRDDLDDRGWRKPISQLPKQKLKSEDCIN